MCGSCKRSARAYITLTRAMCAAKRCQSRFLKRGSARGVDRRMDLTHSRPSFEPATGSLMASSGNFAATSSVEPATPETGDAIAAEIRSRHASIAENLTRLRAVRSVVTKLYRASINVSKVSTEGLVSVEEDEQETPASAIAAPFPPSVALEPILKHDAGGAVTLTFPSSSLSELEAAYTAQLSYVDFWDLIVPEGLKKIALFSPFLRNFRTIDGVVARALEALRTPPSRRDAITAELATANAALGRAAAMGCEFPPVVSDEEATRRQDVAIATAVEEATRRERAAAAAAIDAERAKAAALQTELDALRRPREIPVAPPAALEPDFAPHGLTPPQAAQLQALVGGSGSPRAWAEVYRGSRDGFTAASFQGRCDKKACLLVLARDAEAGWLFGGFTARGFIKGVDRGDYADDGFLFSLTNPAGRPERLASKGCLLGCAVRYRSGYLAVLGNVSGLYIADGCDSNKRSHTTPGTSYADSSVAGSHPMAQGQTVHFTVAELVAWTVPQ